MVNSKRSIYLNQRVPQTEVDDSGSVTAFFLKFNPTHPLSNCSVSFHAFKEHVFLIQSETSWVALTEVPLSASIPLTRRARCYEFPTPRHWFVSIFLKKQYWVATFSRPLSASQSPMSQSKVWKKMTSEETSWNHVHPRIGLRTETAESTALCEVQMIDREKDVLVDNTICSPPVDTAVAY